MLCIIAQMCFVYTYIGPCILHARAHIVLTVFANRLHCSPCVQVSCVKTDIFVYVRVTCGTCPMIVYITVAPDIKPLPTITIIVNVA